MTTPGNADSNAPQQAGSVLTILAVDDDALVLMSTSAMIEELGHTVLEASSAREALEILRKSPNVTLVITDQAMPDMTGVELAAAIRKEWPDLPVILATGYSDLPVGSPDYPMLAKPFTEKDIARAIAQALGRP